VGYATTLIGFSPSWRRSDMSSPGTEAARPGTVTSLPAAADASAASGKSPPQTFAVNDIRLGRPDRAGLVVEKDLQPLAKDLCRLSNASRTARAVRAAAVSAFERHDQRGGTLAFATRGLGSGTSRAGCSRNRRPRVRPPACERAQAASQFLR